MDWYSNFRPSRYAQLLLAAMLLVYLGVTAMPHRHRDAPPIQGLKQARKRGDEGLKEIDQDVKKNKFNGSNSNSADSKNKALRHATKPANSDVGNSSDDGPKETGPNNQKNEQEDFFESSNDSYLPIGSPVIPSSEHSPTKTDRLQVRFLTGPSTEISSVTRFVVDGVERSEYLKLLSVSFLEGPKHVDTLSFDKIDKKDPLMYIVDFSTLVHDCHSVESLLRNVTAKETPGRVLLLDYSGGSETVVCDGVVKMMGKERLRMAKRGIVQDRHWYQTNNWVNVGKLAPNPGQDFFAGPNLHSPYPVREAFVKEMLEKVAGRERNPADLEDRSDDVAMFWRSGDNSHYSFLRRRVGSILTKMNGTKTEGGEYRISTVVQAVGVDQAMEVNHVQSRYVDAVLNTKIVVVAQRDEWEDNYRLLESMACGALVLTDFMISLPDGLKNKKHLLVYDGSDELRQLIEHYLDPANTDERRQIARAGWEAVMGRHRSFHRIEGLLFGEPLTHVDRPYEAAPESRVPRFNETVEQALKEVVIYEQDEETWLAENAQ